jgi:2,4-didehydro-3-deoxy-L-rhamnonate hydrolase
VSRSTDERPEVASPRVGSLQGRATLIWAKGTADVAERSQGRWGPDAQSVFSAWDAFSDWATDLRPETNGAAEVASLGPPVPSPRQVFAVGLN